MTTPSQDAALRDAQRHWRLTGSPDDEARYLIERVRAGDLTPERLELAAYCGHEGAGRAIGRVSASPDWAAIGARNHWAAALAGSSAAASVAGYWFPGCPSHSPSVVLAAVREWIACPCAVHAEGVRPLSLLHPTREWFRDDRTRLAHGAYEAASSAARCALGAEVARQLMHCLSVAEETARAGAPGSESMISPGAAGVLVVALLGAPGMTGEDTPPQ